MDDALHSLVMKYHSFLNTFVIVAATNDRANAKIPFSGPNNAAREIPPRTQIRMNIVCLSFVKIPLPASETYFVAASTSDTPGKSSQLNATSPTKFRITAKYIVLTRFATLQT